jgi:hypothetical protein
MKLRFVPPRLHGSLDFITSGLFFVGGEVFQIRHAPASSVPARVFGVSVVAYSIFTDYGESDEFELGGGHRISMRTHLLLDAIGGTAVMLAPWIAGTWRKGWNYWAPHVLLGTGELLFAVITKTETSPRK